MKKINCDQHGIQEMSLLCVHLALSIDNGMKVGFYSEENGDTGRPDAWCQKCENAWIEANGDGDAWFKAADFKVVCCSCWDLAKECQAQ